MHQQTERGKLFEHKQLTANADCIKTIQSNDISEVM